jgi:hypothetical protein
MSAGLFARSCMLRANQLRFILLRKPVPIPREENSCDKIVGGSLNSGPAAWRYDGGHAKNLTRHAGDVKLKPPACPMISRRGPPLVGESQKHGIYLFGYDSKLKGLTKKRRRATLPSITRRFAATPRGRMANQHSALSIGATSGPHGFPSVEVSPGDLHSESAIWRAIIIQIGAKCCSRVVALAVVGIRPTHGRVENLTKRPSQATEKRTAARTTADFWPARPSGYWPVGRGRQSGKKCQPPRKVYQGY